MKNRPHGGPGRGQGRKKGSKTNKSKLKEKTKVMRIPLSKVEEVKKLIKKSKPK